MTAAADVTGEAHGWGAFAFALNMPRHQLKSLSRRCSRAYTLHASLSRLGLLAHVEDVTFEITVPANVRPGDKLQAMTPSGTELKVTVPPGAMPGTSLTFSKDSSGVLRLLPPPTDSTAASPSTASPSPPVLPDEVLHVHLLGADVREGSTVEGTQLVFAPLCSLLAGSRWREVNLLLCGPNCFGPRGSHFVSAAVTGGSAGLRVRYTASMYHELSDAERGPTPHVAVAFQGGVWGYDSWGATIALARKLGTPLVLTSYNMDEAEDDEEAMKAFEPSAKWRWGAEANPWRSLEDERSAHQQRSQNGASGKALHENGVWQCLG